MNLQCLRVDRIEKLGITKTHVKSGEMTGSVSNYATNHGLYGSTEPNDVSKPYNQVKLLVIPYLDVLRAFRLSFLKKYTPTAITMN